MEPEFAQVAISNDQALTLLDMYLCAKATDSRDVVQIYGHKILSELAEIGLIKSDQQGRATTFYLTPKGHALAKILDHEKNGTQHDEPYLRLPIPDGGSN